MKKNNFIFTNLLFVIVVLAGLAGCATKKHIVQHGKVYSSFRVSSGKVNYYISSSEDTQDEVTGKIRKKIERLVANSAICLNSKIVSVKTDRIKYSKMVAGGKITSKYVCKNKDEYIVGHIYFKVVALDNNAYMIKKYNR